MTACGGDDVRCDGAGHDARLGGLGNDNEKTPGAPGRCRESPETGGKFENCRRSLPPQADDLWLDDEQLSRWKHLNLTPSQQQEVDRLAAQLPTIRERVTAILALAEALKGGTIEAVLGKSDAELGLEFLLGQRKP